MWRGVKGRQRIAVFEHGHGRRSNDDKGTNAGLGRGKSRTARTDRAEGSDSASPPRPCRSRGPAQDCRGRPNSGRARDWRASGPRPGPVWRLGKRRYRFGLLARTSSREVYPGLLAESSGLFQNRTNRQTGVTAKLNAPAAQPPFIHDWTLLSALLTGPGRPLGYFSPRLEARRPPQLSPPPAAPALHHP